MYHDLFTASAGIFAALWAIFAAMAIFMAQQRATTGARLTFTTALTPARAMLANAYFFTGMDISLVQLLPSPNDAVRFWGEIFALGFVYAPLLMLLVLAFGARSQAIWRGFWNMAPFYVVSSLVVWGLFYAASDRVSTVIFSLLGFGCLWTLISVMYLVFFPNEWSSAASEGGTPEDLAQVNKVLNDTLVILRERGEIQAQQIRLLNELSERVDALMNKRG